jgi:cysteinyl-tRNA synthetase
VDLGSELASVDWDEPHAQRFRDAMDDDFNTPLAVAELFDLASEVNRSKSATAARQLKALAGVLGLLERNPQAFLQAGSPGEGGLDEAAIVDAITRRAAAKKARNFAEADAIRAELTAGGVVLEDKPDGTTNWRRA